MQKSLFLVIAAIWMSPMLVFAVSFERDLFYGIRNDPDVRKLQEFMAGEGVYSGPTTGSFLSLTREGVKKFQEREGITPTLGYFGPKTRKRANDIAVQKTGESATLPTGSKSEQIVLLQAKIAELTKRLGELRAELAKKETPPQEKDTLPPAFVVIPKVASAGFVSGPPLGVRYPYRVTFDRSHDELNPSEESVSCTPVLKSGTSAGKKTEYFPEASTNYSCSLLVKDQAGNEARAGFAFSSPAWASVVTKITNPFPALDVTPFKIGEFMVYNGANHEVLFAYFEVLLVDEMDSTPNRNRKVYFKLRDGPAAGDTEISETTYTFILAHPKIGEPHKSILRFPFGKTFKAGEEKVISLWVEQFKYVKSGTLQIKSQELFSVTEVANIRGGFDFVLTRKPPL